MCIDNAITVALDAIAIMSMAQDGPALSQCGEGILRWPMKASITAEEGNSDLFRCTHDSYSSVMSYSRFMDEAPQGSFPRV